MLSLDDQVVRGGCSSHVVFLFLSFLWLPNSLGSAAPGRWKASWTLGWPMFSATPNVHKAFIEVANVFSCPEQLNR